MADEVYLPHKDMSKTESKTACSIQSEWGGLGQVPQMLLVEGNSSVRVRRGGRRQGRQRKEHSSVGSGERKMEISKVTDFLGVNN